MLKNQQPWKTVNLASESIPTVQIYKLAKILTPVNQPFTTPIWFFIFPYQSDFPTNTFLFIYQADSTFKMLYLTPCLTENQVNDWLKEISHIYNIIYCDSLPLEGSSKQKVHSPHHKGVRVHAIRKCKNQRNKHTKHKNCMLYRLNRFEQNFSSQLT